MHCHGSRPPISPSPCSAGFSGVVDGNVGYARAFWLRAFAGTFAKGRGFFPALTCSWTSASMFAHRPYSRAISSDLREIEGRLRALENRLQRIGSRTSAGAALAAEGIGEAVASALNSMAERFRGGANSVSGEAAKLGGEAAKLGNEALRRLSDEVEHHPLVTIAVALGVGVLVGLAWQRH
jgi:ElaB/YqjD/DUF883 family membrane-anchored ribosome-binding protein